VGAASFGIVVVEAFLEVSLLDLIEDAPLLGIAPFIVEIGVISSSTSQLHCLVSASSLVPYFI
jgi:hypothetical protein